MASALALVTRAAGSLRSLFNPATYRNSSIRYVSPPGSAYANEWQKGGGGTGCWDPLAFPAAEACVARIAEAVATMALMHERIQPDGSRERVTASPIERTIRKPNGYQTGSDLMTMVMRSELVTGNGYAVRIHRNGRSFDELHPLPPGAVQHFAADDGAGGVAIYYRINASNRVVDFNADQFVPARDMLHLRRNNLEHPLEGRSPLYAAAASVSAGSSINAHQAAFYRNMSRPSGVLATDKVLNRDQSAQLREAWEQQASGLDSGRIPILSAGIKWSAFSLTAADAELVAAYGMTVADVARAFGVPPAIVGDLTNASYNTTEALIQHWLSTSLGAVLNRVEESFEDLFGFGEGDRVNDRLRFDTDALLRADFKSLIEGLTQGVRGGVFTVNEARARFYLPPVQYGDEVRVQQQDVPLSAWHEEQKRLDAAPEAGDDAAPAQDDAAGAADAAADERRLEAMIRGLEAAA